MPFPTLQPEVVRVSLQFALLLRDGFADSEELLGAVTVSSGTIQGQQKDSSGAFLFYNLPLGLRLFTAKSSLYTPYYLPAAINAPVPMPSPLWPAFPDQTVADPKLPLGDPGQTAAYKAQRQQATLLPSTAYPFPGRATLIRGTVVHNDVELAGATVQESSGVDPLYTTGPDGQFVLYVSSPPGLPQQMTLVAKHAGFADVNAQVTVTRGLTVSVIIKM